MPTADLEQILASIAPENAQDREVLLTALRSSSEKDNPSILALIANLEAQNGQLESALANINKALRRRPKVTSFILMKANLLIALSDQEGALKWYSKSSRKYKKNLDIRLAEIRYLIQLNQSQLALEKLENVIEANPKAEEALFIAGLTSIDLKQYDKAEQYLVDLRNSAKYQK